MITFNYETDFTLEKELFVGNWITDVIKEEESELGELNYIFCDDVYLHSINVEFLQHDTFTDIISFDYSMGKTISGDVFISIDRVRENAEKYNVTFENELYRVMIHGVLHYLGFKDKTEEQKKEMRNKENKCLKNINI